MSAEKGGIALLSLYNDDDDDEEEDNPSPPPQNTQLAASPNDTKHIPTPPQLAADSAATPISDEEMAEKTLGTTPVARSPTPPPLLLWSKVTSPNFNSAASPADVAPNLVVPQRVSVDSMRTGSGLLGINDYGEDEAAMSPDHEEGEILANAKIVTGAESQVVDVTMVDGTPPGNVHALRSGVETESSEIAFILEQSKPKTNLQMNLLGSESDEVSREGQNDDPLSKFLPPLPSVVEDPEKLKKLQDKINKFLMLKKAGKSFNAELRNRKDYRNPDFLQHAVRYQDIDQTGTCFSKDVFDPLGYDKSDFYDEIEKDMRRDAERKEQERKTSQKVDFISSGLQHVNALASKMNTQNPGTSAATTGVLPGSVGVETVGKDRQNKKTKWDKVDGDVNNPIISGINDNSTATHATHLSASNAGGGYAAFALHKRKEVEEKRSSDRKFDKKS